MPRSNAPRRTTPLRLRIASLAGAVVLVVALAAVPGGPGPAAAAPPRDRVATHSITLEPAGRASVRTLARQETVARPSTAVVPRRLGWQRSGRPAQGDDGGTTIPTGAGTTAPASAAGALPSGAAGVLPSGAAAELDVAAAGGPGVVGTSWDGLTDQAISCGSSRPCVEPPDPWVAVSATHVVQMVNQSTRITTRTGGAPYQLSNRTFFGVPTWSSTAFTAHPRVLYDPSRDRWVATLFAGTCSGGALFVAVSETGDPTGSWQKHYLAFPGAWPDYPALGTSSALVAVGVNEYDVRCGTGGASIVGAYRGASLHVFDWADLVDGGGAPTASSTAPNPSAFTFAPAAGLSAGDAIHAVVALDDGTSNTADLGYASVSGTVAGDDIVVAAPVSLTPLPLGKLQQPPTPLDAGGLIGVQHNALDLRPTDAVWRAGRLAVATTASCLRGTTYRPCARVIELATQPDLAPPTLRQDLRISPTSPYSDTYVPGVGYSDDGTLWTVFSQSSSSRYVSSWARRQAAADPPGAWSAGAALIAGGRGPYGGTAGAGLNERWGDYVGVARDPAEPASVWQANQVVDTGGGWTTRVARLGDDTAPPVLTAPRPGFVSNSVAGQNGIPVRIAWGASDAGSGIGSVRLERSLNGGAYVPVTLGSTTALEMVVTHNYNIRYQYRVAATDNAGNAAPDWVEGPSFTPTLVWDSSYLVAYSGTWGSARSTSYLGGAARYASTAGKRATITVSGFAIAWVSTAGASRGSARVYADGVLQGTYSTYRSTAAYRRVVTSRSFATPGLHTLRIEVKGTAGHPRVDVDSFAVLR